MAIDILTFAGGRWLVGGEVGRVGQHLLRQLLGEAARFPRVAVGVERLRTGKQDLANLHISHLTK